MQQHFWWFKWDYNWDINALQLGYIFGIYTWDIYIYIYIVRDMMRSIFHAFSTVFPNRFPMLSIPRKGGEFQDCGVPAQPPVGWAEGVATKGAQWVSAGWATDAADFTAQDLRLGWKPWENHGKTMGKPWENGDLHRKTIGFQIFSWEYDGKP